MSVLCNCHWKNPINCPLKLAPGTCSPNTLLRGQVFDLTSNCPYPPFHRKKLTTREVRDAVDKNELWFYIPPWQVPKVEYTCIQCRRFVIQNTPMKKIICMAKKNMTINGPVGEKKVSIPRFGKAKLKLCLKEAYKKCESMKIKQNDGGIIRKKIKENMESSKKKY